MNKISMCLSIVFCFGLVACNGSGGGSSSGVSTGSVVCNSEEFQSGDGSVLSPYIICSASQFENIGNNLFLNFKLLKNVDMGGIDLGFGQFEGVLDGAGFSVVNFNISSNPVDDGTALFRKSLNATIKNITFSNVTSSSVNELRSAIVVGAAESTTFEYVNVENVSLQGGSQVGLLVGYSDKSTFFRTFTSGSVSASGAVGGSVGVHSGAATRWHYMINRASVTSTSGVAGGIVGQAYGVSEMTEIENSGNVLTGGSYAGGISGEVYNANYSYLVNSGDVTAASNVGGIFGEIDVENSFYSYLSLTNSSSSGDLEATTNVLGGIVGRVKIDEAISSLSFQGLDVRDVALLTVGADYGAVFGLVENPATSIPSPYYCDDLIVHSGNNGTVNALGPNSTIDVSCTNISDLDI